MDRKELCKWLRDNSSGAYRKAAEAADEIERLENALIAIVSIENKVDGGDWDEIGEARLIAHYALK